MFVKLVKKAFVVESLEHCLAYIRPEKITDQRKMVSSLKGQQSLRLGVSGSVVVKEKFFFQSRT